jgi:hypothetical protein
MANRSHSAEEKAMLINMADTWDSLAIDRESHIARQKRLAALEGRTAKRIWRAPFRSINSTLRTMSERRRFRPVGSNANIRGSGSVSNCARARPDTDGEVSLKRW